MAWIPREHRDVIVVAAMSGWCLGHVVDGLVDRFLLTPPQPPQSWLSAAFSVVLGLLGLSIAASLLRSIANGKRDSSESN